MSETGFPAFSMWTAEDDLLLKNAVEAGAALEALAKGAVRFSRRFTIKELRERWHALLYTPEISAMAAARMVEFELSQMGLPKQTRSRKLKSNEEIVQKQRPDSVRNCYYRMRKRIDAERILSLDENCIFANESAVDCIGITNKGFREAAATSHAALPATVEMEGTAVVPSFGLSVSSLDIEDETFSQMDSLLAAGGVEAVGNAFTTNSTDAMEVDSAAVSDMPNGCYDFSRCDTSIMLSATAVVSGNEYISAENVHQLAEDMPEAIVENTSTIHHMPYVVESCLSLDAIRTALTIDDEPIVNPLPVYDCDPSDCKAIDTRFVGTGLMQEASVENFSTLGMLSQQSIGNWEADAVFLTPSATAAMKDNADEQIVGVDDKADRSGLKEPQRDGCLMLDSFTTKEDVDFPSEGLNQSLVMRSHHESIEQSASHILSTGSEIADLYGSGDGHDMLDKAKCLDVCYNISVTPVKVEAEPESSGCLHNRAVGCFNNSGLERSVCEQSQNLDMVSASTHTSPLPTQVGQECKNVVVKLGVAPFTFHENCQPLLSFVYGPMVCTLNTEDTEVPCNDDFVPLVYQELSPISAAVQFSYAEKITARESMMTKGMLGNQRPRYSGLDVVKKEPVTLEKHMEADSEWRQVASKDEESNKSCTDYNGVKLELFEFTVPSVVCQDEIAKKDDCNAGIPSSIVSTAVATSALQEGISTVPLVLENNSGNKFDLLASHESIRGAVHDDSVDFTRPLQFKITLPAIQDNLEQICQAEPLVPIEVGLKDSQVMNSEDAAAYQFPVNQEVQFSDSDEELPHFSDVEAMILDMDLDPGDDESFSAIAESKRLYKHHKRVLVRLDHSAKSAMQRSLVSKGASAVLYGHHLKYFIRKNEVSIGRATQDNIVDIDLGKETRANKVSRRQAIIRMKEGGVFYLENHGKRSIAVNSHVIASGQCICLGSNCLIEIGGMSFIFEMDKRLAKKLIEPVLQARFPG